MSDEGRIASRIFSKHLVIHDEFEDDQENKENENDESNNKLNLSSPDKIPEDPPQPKKGAEVEKIADSVINIPENKSNSDAAQASENKNEIPDIGNLSAEFMHAAAMGGNPEEINIEGSKELFKGDNKMMDEQKGIGAGEAVENAQPELNLKFDDEEGETLVLNFQTPAISTEDHKEPDSIQIPEFQDFQGEEFPKEISLFQDTQVENSEHPDTSETVNFETQQPKVESMETPKFEFVDDGSDGQEEPIDEASIIDDSQGRVIEEEVVEKPPIEKAGDSEKDQSEEKNQIDGILTEFPALQDISSEIKGFLLNNIDILTQDRLAICIDLGLALEEIKRFFIGNLNEADRKLVYNKLRKVEMQYIFEDFIQCFNIESFTRKKETIDGKTVRNIVVLKEDIFIDGYESLNTAHDIDVKPGESIFILSDELEINIENYIDEIKAAKLNAENVYLMILDGAIVDDDAVKLAARYGIKIVDMDTPISTVNKNLEEIKKGIIV